MLTKISRPNREGRHAGVWSCGGLTPVSGWRAKTVHLHNSEASNLRRSSTFLTLLRGRRLRREEKRKLVEKLSSSSFPSSFFLGLDFLNVPCHAVFVPPGCATSDLERNASLFSLAWFAAVFNFHFQPLFSSHPRKKNHTVVFLFSSLLFLFCFFLTSRFWNKRHICLSGPKNTPTP